VRIGIALHFGVGLGLVLFACAGASSGSAGFSIAYPEASDAHTKVGKHFYAKPSAHCVHDNGLDARWATTGAHVVSGELPPGIAIEDGALTGTPTKAGQFSARIELAEVTCAGKPYPNQTVDVKISVR
jgi:hypothetical protein